MALNLSTKKTAITNRTAAIATDYETICTDLSYDWSGIQTILDSIDTKSGTVQTNSLSILNSDTASSNDANKNYGIPCGVVSVLGNTDVNDIFASKWNLFSTVADGTLLDDSISLINADMDDYTCAELEEYLGGIETELDSSISKLSTIASKLSLFSTLNDEIMGVIGSIGSILGCSDEMYSALSTSSTWLDEINPTYSSALNSITEAKATGGTQSDVYTNSIQNADTKLSWESQLADLKTDFSDLEISTTA